MENSERIKRFDLLKVIAMLYVCFSHVYQRTVPNATQTIGFGVFYSVHMAIFMFVGGYFIKRTDSFLGFVKYLGKMLALYIYPSVLFTILTVISMKRYASHDVLYWLNEFFVRTDTFYWYAVSAIIINALLALAYFISCKIVRKGGLKLDIVKNLTALGLFAIFILPVIFIFKSKTPGMLASNLTIEFLPLAVMGFTFRSFAGYFKQTKGVKIAEFVAFLICLALYIVALINFKGWLDKGTTLKLILHQLGSMAGVYVYYALAKWLSKFFDSRKLSALARHSFPLYLVHVYLIRVITPYVSRVDAINFYTLSFVVIYALVFTLGSLLITALLTKNKYVKLVLFGDYNFLLNAKTK